MYYKVIGSFQDIYMDEITEILFSYDAISVSTEYVKKGIVKIIAIFYEIEESYTFLLQNNFNIEKCIDDQWEDEWYSTYEGGELTENIYVTPYDKIYSLDYKYVIKIDPRKAFGDGLHPTTKICANFLEKLIVEENLAEKDIQFIDIGCGTGILSIEASLLGLKNIDAIDLEEIAVESSKKNFELNNISGINIMATGIEVFCVKKRYDIVCANLQTAIIEKNIDNLLNIAKDDSILVFSGINYIWEKNIINLFKSKKLKIIEKKRENEWLGFITKKNIT